MASLGKTLILAVVALLHVTAVAQGGSASDIRLYKLAPGDRIVVTVFGQTDLSGDFSVDGTGNVLLPLIGAVEVMNLTAPEAQQRITALLQDGILQRPVVNVGIAEVRPIHVMGDVRTPGVYPFRFGSIVKGAIAQAGGYGLAEQFPGAATSELLVADERLRLLADERKLLLIRQARLEAQLNGAKTFEPPLSPAEAQDPETAKLVKQEKEIFETDSAAFENQIDTIVSQKPQFQSESDAIDGQIASGEKQLEIVRKQMEEYNKLIDKGLGRSNAMVEIQLGEANILTNNYRLKADQFRVRNQIVALDIQLVEYENTYKRRLQEDLRVVQQRLREIDVTLPSARQGRDLRAQLSGQAHEGMTRTITVTRLRDGVVASFESSENALLEPGDIVEVKSTQVGAGRTAGPPALLQSLETTQRASKPSTTASQ